jgi:hypothetical protein
MRHARTGFGPDDPMQLVPSRRIGVSASGGGRPPSGSGRGRGRNMASAQTASAGPDDDAIVGKFTLLFC